MVGGIATHDADGECLGDVLGDRQQLRHRLERAAQEILVEPGDDHPLAAIRQHVAGGRKIQVEELPFVDPTTSVPSSTRQLVRAAHRGRYPHVAVRDDVIVLNRLSTAAKIWTFWRAICARQKRRISSSLLPLNMLPVMTSIHPCCALTCIHEIMNLELGTEFMPHAF
jgi:hypothetical protein